MPGMAGEEKLPAALRSLPGNNGADRTKWVLGVLSIRPAKVLAGCAKFGRSRFPQYLAQIVNCGSRHSIDLRRLPVDLKVRELPLNVS